MCTKLGCTGAHSCCHSKFLCTCDALNEDFNQYKTKLPCGVRGPVSSQDYVILTSSCSTAEASFERFNEYANIIFSNLGPFKTWGVQHQLCQPLSHHPAFKWTFDCVTTFLFLIEKWSSKIFSRFVFRLFSEIPEIVFLLLKQSLIASILN